MIVRSFFLTGAVLALCAGVVFWRLMDHDLDRRASEPFDFSAQDLSFSGTLWLPNGTPRAAIVIVHGDGPQDRTSAGGYAPLINMLLDNQIAVASWDKPGVTGQGGHWLNQSMADRAVEARAALDRLAGRFDGIPIGAIGFSQAGWVLPRLTSDDADFIVLIGPAISWQEQGEYFTRTRLGLEGLEEEEIARVLRQQHYEDERIFGADAGPSDAPDGMSTDRWHFIRENRHEDARAALARLDIPLLAIWGADDLNVDAVEDSRIYEDILADRDADTQILLWPDATHGLLKAGPYNWQLTDQWSGFAKFRFLAEGRYAFASGSLDAIVDWIQDRDLGSKRRDP